MTYLDAQVSTDRARVDLRLRMSTRDTAEPLQLEPDTAPSDAHIVAHAADMLDYVIDRIAVEGDEQDCTDAPGGVTVEGDFAVLTWAVTCPRPIGQLAIEYDLFFDLDPLHTCNLVVRHAGEQAVAPLQVATSRFEWDLRGAPPGPFLPFLRSGVAHIVGGFDHLSFLLGLLLLAVIAAERGRGVISPTGAYGATTLRARGIGPAIRYTAIIATSFTLAHSITLAIAALGWVTLPSRLVESLVAASIIWVAIENLVRADPRRRWLLTFGFGLVHGMAFASILARQLPPSDVALPLVSFNLGVELGQLGIIVVTVPLLHLLASRVLGPDRYRKTVVTFGSVAIAVLGLIWLIERAFVVKLLGL
jgi:hypothetical protein